MPAPLSFTCRTISSCSSVVKVRNGGDSAPAILNAVNEVAVEAFLSGNLRFTAIPEIIQSVLDHADIEDHYDLESVMAADHLARDRAAKAVANHLERIA